MREGQAEKRNIPFSPPDITDREIEEVVATLRSGWITTGPKTKTFEARIAAYCGTPKTVCLNSATAAMELTLRLLGIGPGDEVITSAYTYTASCSVICHVGARPVLVDVEKDTFHLDYNLLADAITEKTKAIIPVDIGGVMCDYGQVLAAAKAKRRLFRSKNKLQAAYGRPVVLADAAHSFGSTRDGIKSGAAADFTAFSFHAVKNLTTAEGGAVTWKSCAGISDEALYKQLTLWALHGQSKDAQAKLQPGAWEYDIVFPGYKCNMTDIMASIGLRQMDRYEAMNQRRREIIRQYDAAFQPIGLKSLQHEGEGQCSNGHLYMLRVPGYQEDRRNALIMRMAEAGIATNVHFKPLPMFSAYKSLGFSIKDFPNAFAQYKNEITLPSYTKLSDEEVNYIIDTLLTDYCR